MPPFPPGLPGAGGPPGGMPGAPPMASPVGPPPGLQMPGAGGMGGGGMASAFAPLIAMAKDNPLAISEITKLIDAIGKLAKQAGGAGGPGRGGRNPMGANIGPADQIAAGQSRTPLSPNPLSMLAAQGMRPAGMV